MQPTVETVGYGRLSLTGLQNPCSSVSSVIKTKIVRRVEGLFALADQLAAPLSSSTSAKPLDTQLSRKTCCYQCLFLPY